MTLDLDGLRSWGRSGLDTVEDAALQLCLDAALQDVERQTGRGVALTQRTVYLNGDDADGRTGEILRLPGGYRPLRYDGATYTVTVVENGTALTVARGWDTTAQVILVGVDEDVVPKLLRNPQQGPVLVGDSYESGWRRWASGVQNIAVTYKAGWDTAAVPDQIGELVFELALLNWRSASHTGASAKSKGGNAVSLTGDLSAKALRTLASLKVAA